MKHDFRPEDFEQKDSPLVSAAWGVVLGLMILGAIWIGLA